MRRAKNFKSEVVKDFELFIWDGDDRLRMCHFPVGKVATLLVQQQTETTRD
jgi:hypothetical protein